MSPQRWNGDTGCMFDIIFRVHVVFVFQAFLKVLVFIEVDLLFSVLIQVRQWADSGSGGSRQWARAKGQSFSGKRNSGDRNIHPAPEPPGVFGFILFFYVYTKNPEEENLWEQIMTQLPMSQTVSLLRRLGSLVRLNVGENNNISKQIQSVTMVEYQWPPFIKLTRKKST